MANPFESWALVELFGHQRIAGKVTEAEIAGGKFLQVDVPAFEGVQPVTRLYSPGAIYGITPLTEETALKLAEQFRVAPMSKWDARALIDSEVKRALPAGDRDDQDDEIQL